MPDALFVTLAVVVFALLIGACLVDLARHEARHLPKPVWALIIVVVSFPLGALAWFLVGRVPRGEERPPAEDRAPTPSAALQVRSEPGDASGAAPPDGALAVRTDGLTKRYGDTAALDSIDLRVPLGATYGLIGPNGSGKTTMLSILAGLRRPTAGTVEVSAPRQRMGLLVDTPLFEPWLTAREVVDLARHLTDTAAPHERVEEVLAEVGLADAIDRRCGGFSRGMLQRLGLAGALVGRPEVLVLDEPSSALDPSGRLLFQGPLTDLLARTSTSYALQVRPPAAGLVAAIEARSWALQVQEYAPGRVRLVVDDAEAAEHEVPGLLAEHHAGLVSFAPATDLESAFLELTR